MPRLLDVPNRHTMSRPWRAAVTILTTAFPRDAAVWERVVPGESADLTPLLRDMRRPLPDRVLIACAQALADGRTLVPLAELVHLSDGRLRLVLDALAIARGGFPID